MIASLLFLVISASLAAAQGSGGPSPVPAASPPAAVSPDPQRDRWLAEAQSVQHAEIIEKGMVAGTISRVGTDVVAKGDVAGPVSIVSGNLYLLGRVNGPISVVGGNATILGSASGPVSVIGGNLRVAGQINGDASVVGGTIERSSGAVIAGSTNTLGGSLARLGSGLWRNHWKKPGAPRSRFGWLWWRGASMLWWIVASALAVLIMPRELENAAARLGREPIQAAGVGVLLWVGILFLCLLSLLLCFFLIGIPLLGLLILAVFAIEWFGLTAVFLWFGRLICERLRWGSGSDFLPVFVGAVLLGLARFIPFGGALIWLVANLLAAGITLLVISGRRNQPPLPPPVAASQVSA